jgi:hypothetical protein
MRIFRLRGGARKYYHRLIRSLVGLRSLTNAMQTPIRHFKCNAEACRALWRAMNIAMTFEHGNSPVDSGAVTTL